MAKKKPGDALGVPRWEPPNHAAVPRQGEPGREYSQTDARGVSRVIRADVNGIVWPETPEDIQLIDTVGLPAATDWWAPDWSGIDDAEPAPADEPETIDEPAIDADMED